MCGKDYRLYIRPRGQSLDVVDIEPLLEGLSNLTINQLLKIAAERGIEIPSKAKRTNIRFTG